MTENEAKVLAVALEGKNLGVEIKPYRDQFCVVIPFLEVDFHIVKAVPISKIAEALEDIVRLLKKAYF